MYTRGRGRNARGQGRNARGSYNNNPRGSRGGRTSGATRDSECYYCHKKGHFAKDCYKKQRDEMQRSIYTIQQTLSTQNAPPIPEVLPLPPSTLSTM